MHRVRTSPGMGIVAVPFHRMLSIHDQDLGPLCTLRLRGAATRSGKQDALTIKNEQTTPGSTRAGRLGKRGPTQF